FDRGICRAGGKRHASLPGRQGPRLAPDRGGNGQQPDPQAGLQAFERAAVDRRKHASSQDDACRGTTRTSGEEPAAYAGRNPARNAGTLSPSAQMKISFHRREASHGLLTAITPPWKTTVRRTPLRRLVA